MQSYLEFANFLENILNNLLYENPKCDNALKQCFQLV